MDMSAYVSPFAGDPNGYGDGYDTAEIDDGYQTVADQQENARRWFTRESHNALPE